MPFKCDRAAQYLFTPVETEIAYGRTDMPLVPSVEALAYYEGHRIRRPMVLGTTGHQYRTIVTFFSPITHATSRSRTTQTRYLKNVAIDKEQQCVVHFSFNTIVCVPFMQEIENLCIYVMGKLCATRINVKKTVHSYWVAKGHG